MKNSVMRKNSFWNDFMDDFGFPMLNNVANSVPSSMKTDIKAVEGGYELDIDLPGFKKEDVRAELKDGYLTIRAEAKTENSETDNNGKFLRRERYFGSCQRSYYVGEWVEQEDVKARFENGLLRLFVPSKEAKPELEEKRWINIE